MFSISGALAYRILTRTPPAKCHCRPTHFFNERSQLKHRRSNTRRPAAACSHAVTLQAPANTGHIDLSNDRVGVDYKIIFIPIFFFLISHKFRFNLMKFVCVSYLCDLHISFQISIKKIICRQLCISIFCRFQLLSETTATAIPSE